MPDITEGSKPLLTKDTTIKIMAIVISILLGGAGGRYLNPDILQIPEEFTKSQNKASSTLTEAVGSMQSAIITMQKDRVGINSTLVNHAELIAYNDSINDAHTDGFRRVWEAVEDVEDSINIITAQNEVIIQLLRDR